MATDGASHESEEADMLPDEAAVLPERGERLDDADEGDLLTVEQARERLGMDPETE